MNYFAFDADSIFLIVRPYDYSDNAGMKFLQINLKNGESKVLFEIQMRKAYW